MDESLPCPPDPKRNAYLELDDRVLLSQSDVDTYRARGPGGQKRNKTDSAVRLRHHPTHLIVIAVESRSQHENRARALKRLRHAIALHIRAPLDAGRYETSQTLATCVTPSGQLRVGVKNARYNHVVAEVLDLLHACGCQVSSTAAKLGISTGNLVAFFQRDVKVKARVNQMRAIAGIKPLR